MQIRPIGGAREFETETQNLLWLMLRQFFMCVPNFTTISQAVLWAAIDSESGRGRNKKEN